jgi:drug/metabolite transporter (DMT)-like permease
MSSDPDTPAGQASPPDKRGKRRTHPWLFPTRERLHPHVRLALTVAVNIALATWVVPRMGKVRGTEYSLANGLQTALEVGLPCAALLALLPVFLFGRDILRLLAIGLFFLPCYVVVTGIGYAFWLWSIGR